MTRLCLPSIRVTGPHTTFDNSTVEVAMDGIEAEYLDAIAVAAYYGDNDTALELQIGLSEYHTLYQTDHEVRDD